MGSISHRFRDKASFRLKNAHIFPPLFPNYGRPGRNVCCLTIFVAISCHRFSLIICHQNRIVLLKYTEFNSAEASLHISLKDLTKLHKTSIGLYVSHPV